MHGFNPCIFYLYTLIYVHKSVHHFTHHIFSYTNIFIIIYVPFCTSHSRFYFFEFFLKNCQEVVKSVEMCRIWTHFLGKLHFAPIFHAQRPLYISHLGLPFA